MSRQFQTNAFQKPLINPLNGFLKSEVPLKRSICLPGLLVEHQVYEPNELETILTQHVLGVHLSDGNMQQMTRIGEHFYSGTFPKDTSVLIPADIPNFMSWKSVDEGLVYVIEPAYICQVAEQACEMNASQVELIGTPFIHDTQIATITHLFQQEISTGGLGGQLYSESLANALMIHLLRHYCVFQPKLQQKSGLSQHQLQQVKDYVNAHFNQTIHLTDLARVTGISQYHFARLFKCSMGIPPYQYVLQQRVERGKQLLHKGEQSIAVVAQMVGFSDQSQFTYHFKRIVGVTPTEMLK